MAAGRTMNLEALRPRGLRGRLCTPVHVLLLALAALTGCGGAILPRRVTTRGLIAEPLVVFPSGAAIAVAGGDGMRLEPGTRIVLDAVSIWRPLEAPAAEISREELEALAYEMREAFGSVLEEALGITRFHVAGSLTARLAIAEKAPSWIVFEHLGTTRPSGGLIADSARPSPAAQALLSRAFLQFVIAGGPKGTETLAAGEVGISVRKPSGADWTWGDVRKAFRELVALLHGELKGQRGASRGGLPEEGGGR